MRVCANTFHQRVVRSYEHKSVRLSVPINRPTIQPTNQPTNHSHIPTYLIRGHVGYKCQPQYCLQHIDDPVVVRVEYSKSRCCKVLFRLRRYAHARTNARTRANTHTLVLRAYTGKAATNTKNDGSTPSAKTTQTDCKVELTVGSLAPSKEAKAVASAARLSTLLRYLCSSPRTSFSVRAQNDCSATGTAARPDKLDELVPIWRRAGNVSQNR